MFAPCGVVDGNMELWDIPGQDCGHAEDERRRGMQEAGHIIFLSDRDIERSESAVLLRDEVSLCFPWATALFLTCLCFPVILAFDGVQRT